MPFYFCNYLLRSEKKNKRLLNRYYNFILKNRIRVKNKYIQIYYDIQNSDGIKFVDKIKKNTIFISACKINFPKKYSKYYFITNNSWNPNFSYTEPISKNIIMEYKNIFGFEENYKINKEGFILIILNNSYGWFKDTCKVKYEEDNTNYFKMINNLLLKIRKYSQRKIVLRLHPKDRNHKLESQLKDKNLNFDIDNETKLEYLMKNTYCVFIQNTKMILDFVNYGIPIFNLYFFKVDYFPEIQIQDISKIENLDDIELPDREKFLERFYSFITFDINNVLIYIHKKFHFMF